MKETDRTYKMLLSAIERKESKAKVIVAVRGRKQGLVFDRGL